MIMMIGERNTACSLLLLLCVLLSNHYHQVESVESDVVPSTPSATTILTSNLTGDSGNSSAPISLKSGNCTCNDTTVCSNSSTTEIIKPDSKSKGNAFFNTIMDKDNQKIYMRAFYVVIGVSGLVVLYLAVKMYRTRKNKSKTKRYGVLNDRQLELGNVDDEEEDNLFDQSRRRLL